VQVKRAMIEHAAEVVVVADSSKVGQKAFAHIAPVAVCAVVLTDSGLAEIDAGLLQEAGVGEVRRCG